MPKLKTNKSAAKRFRFTKKGKIKRRRAGRRHLLGGKSRKLKRKARRPAFVSSANAKRLRRLLPYG